MDFDPHAGEIPEEDRIQKSTVDLKQAQRWETHYMIQNYYTAITREPQDIDLLWISDEAGVLW